MNRFLSPGCGYMEQQSCCRSSSHHRRLPCDSQWGWNICLNRRYNGLESFSCHNEQSIIVKLFVANQIFIAEHVSVYATHHQPPSSAFDFKQVRTIKGIQYILFLAGDIDTFFLLPTAIQHEGRHKVSFNMANCAVSLSVSLCHKEFSGFHLIDIDLPGSCQHKDQSRILVHIYLLEIVELSGTTTPRTDVPDKLSIRRILIQPRITGNKPIFTGLYHLPRIYKIDQALIIRFQRNHTVRNRQYRST